MTDSPIEKVLKDDAQDFYLSDHDRVALIEILAFIASGLEEELFWFNKKGLDGQRSYIELCKRVAKGLANIPVHEEQ